MPRRCNTPDVLRVDLAHALGFPEYPLDATAEPFLNYIVNRYVGRGTLEAYITLLLHIIRYFGNEAIVQDASPSKKSIQELLDTLAASTNEEYFADTKAGSPTRRDDVEDTVLYAIGTWIMMLSSFVHLPTAGGIRKITLSYNLRAQGKKRQPYGENLSGLIKGSCLLPVPGQDPHLEGTLPNDGIVQAAVQLVTLLRQSQDPLVNTPSNFRGIIHSSTEKNPQNCVSLSFLDDLDSLESLSINVTRLNAYTLKVFGAVDVAWTHNISRHLLLSKRDGRQVLEVFALPCALNATSLTSPSVGISPELAQEIKESYCSLFNAWPKANRHAKLFHMLGAERLCWCWSCSAHQYWKQLFTRYRKFSKHSKLGRSQDAQRSEYDPFLVQLIKNEPSDWTPDLFPSLWSRITILEEHLQAAKPWSIWVLFRDRRDTLQFWTFFFATIVVLLTVLQVLLSIAQVVGSFV